MFADRLKELMNVLEMGNPVLSGLSGIGRTNISHFRSGKRVPRYGGNVSEALSEAFVRYAIENQKAETLCRLIYTSEGSFEGEGTLFAFTDSSTNKNTLDPAESDKENPVSETDERRLREALLNWLYEEELKDQDGENDILSDRTTVRTFSERLDKAIQLSGLSNNRLSRLVNVDASLISRYRSGERIPRADSEVIPLMANALWQHIEKNGGIPRLAEYMGINPEEADAKLFEEWLIVIKTPIRGEVSEVEQLLTVFDSYSSETGIILPDPAGIMTEMQGREKAGKYFGYDGFRSAVLRFLSEVLKGNRREIWLYSDQGMDWMLSEDSFFVKWASLMSACVKQGVRIRIIHNVDRGLKEMCNAIRSWLPLYMSGMIEPHYISEKRDGGSFSHTVFICPGAFAITGFHAVGTEEKGLYYYSTDIAELKVFEGMFKKLMADTRPLITFLHNGSLESDTELTGVNFNNINIWIGSDAVEISHKSSPGLVFRLEHPKLCHAFRAYFME